MSYVRTPDHLPYEHIIHAPPALVAVLCQYTDMLAVAHHGL